MKSLAPLLLVLLLAATGASLWLGHRDSMAPAERGVGAAATVFRDLQESVGRSGDEEGAPRAVRAAPERAGSGTPAELYKRGFRLFSEYSASRESKLKGWRMLERSAEGGHLPAKIMIAEHEAGFVSVNQPPDALSLLKPNLARALDYFREAAARQHSASMVNLALLYSSGVGEPRGEHDSPRQLLLSAAAKGNDEAMIHLSNRYLFGHGETADALEAARWRFLASIDHPEHRFGLVDDSGKPLAQSSAPLAELAQLTSLFVQAAEQKDAEAAAGLGRKYLENAQPLEAAALFRLAKSRGDASLSAELGKAEALLQDGSEADSSRVLKGLFGRKAPGRF